MLIAISTNDNLRNTKDLSHLPVPYSVLYELTKLTDEQFEKGIASGAINPRCRPRVCGSCVGSSTEQPISPRPALERSLRTSQLSPMQYMRDGAAP
jgi:hypothetical protein